MCGGNTNQSQKRIFRKDYKRPEYLIDDVELRVELDPEVTSVKSKMTVRANVEERKGEIGDLVLNGEEIELVSITIDGNLLQSQTFNLCAETHTLTVKQSSLPDHQGKSFVLEIENKCFPRKNLELSGLYVSGDLLCTQMEAEGYRRMTYYLDRPDVMAKFKCQLIADKKEYPVLLSNGDKIDSADMGDRHSATFVDPFPKPSYLFAIVAGKLSHLHDTFTTMALPHSPAREVNLFCYADEKYIGQCKFAMDVLKASMKWDEDKYGRQYDLNTFSMVCIEDFNAGAMENKSLTTYNINSVLAHKDTSLDARFERVCTTIGHEYFHNWSGNRVTVRDWFQVTLKEGFTNFRETEFSQDQYSRACKRIETVQLLRSRQFPEDSGPMSHPIRPESYVSIDNFYTMTVYEKGSEVIRMMKVLVGDEGFRKGTDLYFDRYDGKAISCDEFRMSIAEANGRDFTQFERWYQQRGTPRLVVTNQRYDQGNKTYTITFRQELPANASENGKAEPYHIPILTGLIGRESKKEVASTRCFELTDWEQSFTIEQVEEDVVPSILRDFSAPVILEPFLSLEDNAFLMAYDTDPFNIWEAGQNIYKHVILDWAAQFASGSIKLEQPPALPEIVLRGVREILKNRTNDLDFVACGLSLPSVSALEPHMKPYADPIALYKACKALGRQIRAALADEFQSTFNKLYAESKSIPWSISKDDVARRSLQNCCLAYLASVPEERHKGVGAFVSKYYREADNYNDKGSAFRLVMNLRCPEHDALIAEHYELSKNDPAMLDSWFGVQALQTGPSSLDKIRRLTEHPDYKDNTNPNRFRSLVWTMSSNPVVFHDMSGDGYMFIAEEIARFDKVNSYNAALVTKNLVLFQNYSPERQALMVKALEYLKGQNLSKNTLEIVQRGLDAHAA